MDEIRASISLLLETMMSVEFNAEMNKMLQIFRIVHPGKVSEAELQVYLTGIKENVLKTQDARYKKFGFSLMSDEEIKKMVEEAERFQKEAAANEVPSDNTKS